MLPQVFNNGFPIESSFTNYQSDGYKNDYEYQISHISILSQTQRLVAKKVPRAGCYMRRVEDSNL